MQLVIQALVISGYGLTPLSLVTVAASAFAVLFNLLRRFFNMPGHRNRKRLQLLSSKSSLVTIYHSDLLNAADQGASSRTAAAGVGPGKAIEMAALHGTAPFAAGTGVSDVAAASFRIATPVDYAGNTMPASTATAVPGSPSRSKTDLPNTFNSFYVCADVALQPARRFAPSLFCTPTRCRPAAVARARQPG